MNRNDQGVIKKNLKKPIKLFIDLFRLFIYYMSMADEDKKRSDRISKNSIKKGFLKKADRDKGYQKVAKFLILLGSEEASRVLKHFTEDEIEGISREIARIKTIDKEEAAKLLKEFGYLAETKGFPIVGGIEKAEEMLIIALGPDKAQKLIDRIKKRSKPERFSFIKEIDIKQAITILKNESIPVLAAVLSHIDPQYASQIIAGLSLEKQKEIMLRMAKMENVLPEVLEKAEQTLRQKMNAIGDITVEEIDGKAVLTEIMKNMDMSQERLLLDQIEEDNSELAEEIKENLFTIEVVHQIPDKDLQGILKEYTDKELALILKAKPEDIKQRFLVNISSRRREIIKEEYNAIGQVLKSEVDKVTDEFLKYLRKQAERGIISILEKGDVFVE